MKPSLMCPLTALCGALFGGACSSTPEATATATSPAPGATAAANRRPAAPGGSAGSCDVGQFDTWPNCVGKVVTITGKDPGPNVQQHPSSGGPPGASPTVDLYLDVPGGTQIVLHAKRRERCTGAMQATGTLRALDLGGPAGTKESYSGYYVDDADVKCL